SSSSSEARSAHASGASVAVRTGSRRGLIARTERITLVVMRMQNSETTARYTVSTATRKGRYRGSRAGAVRATGASGLARRCRRGAGRNATGRGFGGGLEHRRTAPWGGAGIAAHGGRGDRGLGRCAGRARRGGRRRGVTGGTGGHARVGALGAGHRALRR